MWSLEWRRIIPKSTGDTDEKRRQTKKEGKRMAQKDGDEKMPRNEVPFRFARFEFGGKFPVERHDSWCHFAVWGTS